MDQVERYHADISRLKSDIGRIDDEINSLELKIDVETNSGYKKNIPSYQKQITELKRKRQYNFSHLKSAQAGVSASEKRAGKFGGGFGRGGAGGGHYGGGFGGMRKK